MQVRFGLVCVSCFFGLTAVANAQVTATANAAAAFDGTYRVVSSQKINDMYTSYTGQSLPCPDRKPGPLHIAAGRAHYTTATKLRLAGMVGPQGELTMRSEMLGGSRPARLQATGAVDANGSAHVRQSGSSCSYNFVWQK